MSIIYIYIRSIALVDVGPLVLLLHVFTCCLHLPNVVQLAVFALNFGVVLAGDYLLVLVQLFGPWLQQFVLLHQLRMLTKNDTNEHLNLWVDLMQWLRTQMLVRVGNLVKRLESQLFG